MEVDGKVGNACKSEEGLPPVPQQSPPPTQHEVIGSVIAAPMQPKVHRCSLLLAIIPSYFELKLWFCSLFRLLKFKIKAALKSLHLPPQRKTGDFHPL